MVWPRSRYRLQGVKDDAIIVECDACARRYMRNVEALGEHEQGHGVCVCGAVLGAWDGRYRFDFEPEDVDPDW